MSLSPHTEKLPVIELPPLEPEPVDPILGGPGIRKEYNWGNYVEAMIQHGYELVVFTERDLAALRKAIDRVGRKPWTSRVRRGNGKEVIQVRLRAKNEAASPFWRGPDVDLDTIIVDRGKWRALALAAVADGFVELDGSQADADKVVWAASLLARRHIRDSLRPKPRESYFVEPAGSNRWRVKISQEARDMIAMAMLVSMKKEDDKKG